MLTLGITCYNSSTSFIGWCNFDWAKDIDNQWSIPGYLIQHASGPISWQSKKQFIVTFSTVESKYMTVASAIKEALWIYQLVSNPN
jgi:hypothetical protein